MDGIQLIDSKENFTIIMHERFKLNPLSFVTLPSLSLEAAIRTSRMELELLTDVNIILYYEKDIRKISKNDLSLRIGK